MAKKETSSEVSSIAARCLSFPETATHAEIKSMAASCLSQDETPGVIKKVRKFVQGLK